MRLSVVIPAHNEEGSLAATVEALVRALCGAQIDHEIVIVNDHSTDGTPLICSDLEARFPTVRPINNLGPGGFGFAVRCGLDHFKGDAVAIYMADGSDAASDLVNFFRVMETQNVACVFGSRFSPGGKVIDYPYLKLFLNRLANNFIRLIFGFTYDDTTNAFKLYRKDVISALHPLLSHHFNLTVELPLKAIIRGFQYSVVPNSWINRKSGESKLSIREMGSRYMFIVLYCLLEKWLSRGDYVPQSLKEQSPISIT